MIRRLIKPLVPLFLREPLKTLINHLRPRRQYWPYYLIYCALLSRHVSRRDFAFKLDGLQNVLHNSGAVPVKKKFSSAREIVDNSLKSTALPQGIEGFEGFRPVDAVFDDKRERGELWSNARLAGVIAAFGHAHYQEPSILDLGCGPAHLFFFFRRYGVVDYLGVDGSPYFIEFNPLLEGFERHFRTLDLQDEIRFCLDPETPCQFDIVTSFEVLEHMREDKIDNFIRTMRNHMHSESVAFCTASTNQNVAVHVLVRDRDWWAERFARFGLFPRVDERKLCSKIAAANPFNWEPRDSHIFALELQG